MNALVRQEAKVNLSPFRLGWREGACNGSSEDRSDFRRAGGGLHLGWRRQFDGHHGSFGLCNCLPSWDRTSERDGNAEQPHAPRELQDVLAIRLSQDENGVLGGANPCSTRSRTS